MTKRHKRGDYEVGYGKPPVHTRFQPGNRAAARGDKPRRTKPRTFEAMLAKMLAKKRLVAGPDGNEALKTQLELIAQSFVITAMKPHSLAALRALRMLMDMTPVSIFDRAMQSVKIEFVTPDKSLFDFDTKSFLPDRPSAPE